MGARCVESWDLRNKNQGPKDDELEVSVFGPGVGESVLIHYGSQQWIVIDSCRDSRSGDVAALSYLREIGLDPASSLRWVVATHAHDDHIDGIAEIVAQCPDARVALPSASSCEEFFALTKL